MNNKIKICDVTIAFGTKKIINNASINIKDGESLVILGCSGSGKSVFIKSIAGLIPIQNGTIKINNEHIKQDVEYNASRHNIGISFQNDALFDSMNVMDNVCFGLIHKCKLSKQDSKRIALKIFELMGFEQHIGKLMPSELSGGMRKRVSVMRTIVLNPEIALFDEPTTGLDPINSAKIIKIIQKYITSKKVTSIIITHSLKCAEIIADSIAFIHNGQIIWHGKKDELKNTQNIHIIDFLDQATVAT